MISEAFDALQAEQKESIPSTVDSTIPVFSKINLSANNRAMSTAPVTIQINGIAIDVQDGASETVIRNTLLAIQSLC